MIDGLRSMRGTLSSGLREAALAWLFLLRQRLPHFFGLSWRNLKRARRLRPASPPPLGVRLFSREIAASLFFSNEKKQS